MNILEVLEAIGNGDTVQCTVGAGEPVIYKVKTIEYYEELTVNGKIYDYRDFCFSPSQILWGEWKMIKEDTSCGKCEI